MHESEYEKNVKEAQKSALDDYNEELRKEYEPLHEMGVIDEIPVAVEAKDGETTFDDIEDEAG
jgi:hypothetical protein